MTIQNISFVQSYDFNLSFKPVWWTQTWMPCRDMTISVYSESYPNNIEMTDAWICNEHSVRHIPTAVLQWDVMRLDHQVKSLLEWSSCLINSWYCRKFYSCLFMGDCCSLFMLWYREQWHTPITFSLFGISFRSPSWVCEVGGYNLGFHSIFLRF